MRNTFTGFIASVFILCSLSPLAQNVGNYKEQGGDVQVITTTGALICQPINSATNLTLTRATSGHVYTNAGASSTAITFTLPAAELGVNYIFNVVDSATVAVDCHADDRIQGTNADGDKLQNTGTTGNHIGLIARIVTDASASVATVNWVQTTISGTWSDAN